MNSSDYIFQNKTSTHKNKDNNEDKLYTMVGMHDSIDNEANYIVHNDKNKVFAKRVYDANGARKLYIRLANNGNIYNPISVYGEEKTYAFLDRVCKDGIKFREVNQKVFDMYLKFLGTKNIAWLHNTEREAI